MALPGMMVEVFVNIEPATPVGRRFVAHVFDPAGKLLPATQVGPSADRCREQLTAFLTAEIAKHARKPKPVGSRGGPPDV